MNNAGEVVLEQVFKNGIVVYGADSLEFKQFKMYRCVQIAAFNDYMKYIAVLNGREVDHHATYPANN